MSDDSERYATPRGRDMMRRRLPHLIDGYRCASGITVEDVTALKAYASALAVAERTLAELNLGHDGRSIDGGELIAVARGDDGTPWSLDTIYIAEGQLVGVVGMVGGGPVPPMVILVRDTIDPDRATMDEITAGAIEFIESISIVAGYQ